jgi:hypothetical protein
MCAGVLDQVGAVRSPGQKTQAHLGDVLPAAGLVKLLLLLLLLLMLLPLLLLLLPLLPLLLNYCLCYCLPVERYIVAAHLFAQPQTKHNHNSAPA